MANKQFTLSKNQYSALGKLVSRYGGDIDDIIEEIVTEKAGDDFLKKSSAEMEKTGKVVVVDKTVLSNIEEFIKLGLDAKEWYDGMNKKIIGALGDSDGTLFLMLMAIFSANATLQTNFRNASRMFEGIKSDVTDSKKRKVLEEMLNEPKLYDILKSFQTMSLKNLMNTMKLKRRYLSLGVVKALQGVRGINSYLPNVMRILKMYKSSGYKFSKRDVVDELSKTFDPNKGTLGKNTIVSAEKIFSFTLNLLDPGFKFEGGWMPVTIDTWMATFFFPYMDKKEKTKFLSRKSNYAYLAKITTELASKFGMQPHELQAICWVATLRKKKGENYSVDFNQAIKKNLQKMKVSADEIKNISSAFDKVIATVGAV